MGGSRGWGQGSGPSPPIKSQVAIGFLKKFGTSPLERQLDPRYFLDPQSRVYVCRLKSGKFGPQVNSDTHLQTV